MSTNVPTNLKALLAERGITLKAMADAVGTSRTWISLLCNHGMTPQPELAARITAYLAELGITTTPTAPVEKKKAPQRTTAVRPVAHPNHEEDEPMVINKPRLHQSTRQHFGLRSDPFADPNTLDEVYLSRDMRGVLEVMRETAMHPGQFVAVVGESGAGKTTLTDVLMERLQKTDTSVTVIRPEVQWSTDKMEAGKPAGKPINSQFLGEFILSTLTPGQPMRSSAAARQEQIKRTLIASARTGERHLLLIEEAHDLSRTMLKQLKRLLELRDGMMRTLSVLLIAQPELLHKLNPNDASMREVTARCEIVHLPPLDNDLVPYLTHRFQRAGVALDAVIDAAAIDALRDKMSLSARNKRGLSQIYPLALHNALISMLNAAADIGAPKVTRDFVGGVA